MKQKLLFTNGWWMKSRLIVLIMLSMINIGQIFAQERTVNGSVKDESGNPIFGVNIVIKGTNSGGVTDLDGKFSINVPNSEAVLAITFIGYTPQEIKVGAQSVIDVILKEESTQINEIVVVGYGALKKKLVTGANVHVGGEEMQEKHALRLEQSLQGLTSGVQIISNSGQPGEGLKVRIRGVGTVGNSDPLYIVDGVQTGDIAYLNPSDVESVDVLKDAASAAIYGARAANGVILITTKKGKAGDLKVSYDGYYGVQNAPKKLKMLNTKEYCMIMNEQITNMAKPGSNPTLKYSPETIDTIQGSNWMDYIYTDNAPIQSHVVSLTGGTEKSNFSSSLSYFNQEGIIGSAKSQYERFSFRINSEHKLYKNFLKFGENLTYSHMNKKGIGVDNIYNNSIRSFLNTSPTFLAYDPSNPDGFGRPWTNTEEANPVGLMYYGNQSTNSTDKILGDVYAELEIMKGLTFKSDFGIDLSYYGGNSYTPVYHLADLAYNEHSRARMNLNRDLTYSLENYLTYTKTIGKHNITALIGNTIREYDGFWIDAQKEDLIMEGLDYAVLSNGTNLETQQMSGSKASESMLSYFGRFNYNYNEKYLLSAVCRRDGSSMFGPENRFGIFPSVSAGWVLTQEDFIKQAWLEFLKIRASWGQNGNDRIVSNGITERFAYMSLIQSTERDYYFGVDETKYIGSSPSRAANAKIKWEASEQSDIGLDARFLKGFILAFDWYKKTTKDWLLVPPVSDILGYESAPFNNGGSVENKGMEFNLGYQGNGGDFNYSINGNITFNKNEVITIENTEKVIHGRGSILFNGHDEYYRAQVGYPVGYFYGYKTDGIFQNQAQIDAYSKDGKLIQPKAVPGDVIFQDLNNDGVINVNDKTNIGDPYPDFTYGASFNADYKGFDFSISIQGIAGNQLINGTRDNSRAFANYTEDVLNRWHGEGTSNKIPRVTPGNDQNLNYKRISDLYVHNGDYLKIRSLNLGYDFSRSLLRGKIEQFRVYVSALNLKTFTKYSGLEPEVGWGPDSWSPGHDVGFYPQPRSILVGLNVKF